MSARQRAGGLARQAQIKAVLGENGYRRYQQALARAGGIARQAQLRASLGEDGYAGYQRSLYQRAVQKHGAAKMQAILTAAHERQRNVKRKTQNAKRLRPGAALLRCRTFYALRFTLYAPEGRVLGYACDLLLPAHALVIEVVGGVHALTAERDAARLAALQAQGLSVITLPNEQLYSGEADDLFDHLLEVRHAA